MYPYKAQIVQKLVDGDKEQRILFCRWALDRICDDPDFFRFVLYTDEAGFTNRGVLLNKQNMRYWAEENPHWVVERTMQSTFRFNVWAGVVDDTIIGPHFFDGNLDESTYCNFLETILPEMLENVPSDVRQRMWWQQDAHPAHTAHTVRAILNEHFPERWLGKFGTVNFPPRSPDLTIMDFFVWGTVKDKVYREAPTTAEDMRVSITAAFQSITADMLRRARDSFRRRCQLCIEREGSHVEQFL